MNRNNNKQDILLNEEKNGYYLINYQNNQTNKINLILDENDCVIYFDNEISMKNYINPNNIQCKLIDMYSNLFKEFKENKHGFDYYQGKKEILDELKEFYLYHRKNDTNKFSKFFKLDEK